MSGLLYVVVELTKLDKREASLDQVQRDMQRAMDYIVDDLQEAVYVYIDPATVTDQLGTDSKFPSGGDVEPILAFWRVDPLEGTDIDKLKDDCTEYSTDEKDRICEVLKIRQASYTLVVYLQAVNDDNDKKWLGQSRLIRYQLPRYTATGLETLDEQDGYRDPTKQDDSDARFDKWKVDDTGGTVEIPEGEASVLVDFVQNPNISTLDRSPLSDQNSGSAEPCYGYGTVPIDTDEDPSTPSVAVPFYNIVPTNASTTANNTFFACVRNPDPDGNTTDNSNQDVYVFLRGSIQGASGGVSALSDESSLPILETQVLVRGVVDKNLQ